MEAQIGFDSGLWYQEDSPQNELTPLLGKLTPENSPHMVGKLTPKNWKTHPGGRKTHPRAYLQDLEDSPRGLGKLTPGVRKTHPGGLGKLTPGVRKTHPRIVKWCKVQ